MAYDYYTTLGITYDSKQAQSELAKVIKSLQKDSKLLINLELSNKDLKKVIEESNKLWVNYRKEAISSIAAPNTELKKMAQNYKNLEAEQHKLLKNSIAQNKIADSIDNIKNRTDAAKTIFSAFVKTINSNALKDQLSVIDQLSNALENVNQASGEVEFSNATTSMKQFKAQAKETGEESKSFGQGLKENVEGFAQSLIFDAAKTKITDVLLPAGEVAAAAEGATVATSMLGAAMELLPIVAVGAGIIGLVELLDYSITTTAELEEKVEESATAYETARTNLQYVNTELATQNDLMEKLLAKDNLTFAEKNQLESLREITQELQIQKDLEEKGVARTQKEAATSSADLVSSKFEVSKFSASSINREQNFYKENEGSIDISTSIIDETNLSKMIAGYREYIKLRDKANSEEDYQNNSATAEDISNSLWESASALEEQKVQMQDYYDTIEKTEKAGGILTPDQKKVKESYEQTSNAIELIYKELEPKKWNIFQFNSLFNADSFSKTRTELLKLAKSGHLDRSVLESKKYKSILDQTGLSASEAVKQIMSMAEANDDLASAEQEVASKKPNMSDYISSLQEIGDLQKNVNDELKNGDISNSTLVNLAQKYPEMEQLITNYQAGVKGSQQDLLNALQENYNTDLMNYGNYMISKNAYNKSFFQSTFLDNEKLVKDFTAKYQIDLSNVGTYAGAKYKIEHKLFTEVTNMWKNYYNAQTNSFSESFEKMGMRLGTLALGKDKTAYNTALANYKLYQDAISQYIDINNTFDKIVADATIDLTEPIDKISGDTINKFSAEINWANQSIQNLEKSISNINSALDNTSSLDGQIDKYKQLIDAQTQLQIAYSKSAKSYKESYLDTLSTLSKKDQTKYKKLIEGGSTFKIEDFSDENTYNTVTTAQTNYQSWQDKKQSTKEAGYSISESADKLADVRWDKAEKLVGKNNKDIDLLEAKYENADSLKEKNSLLDAISKKQEENVSIYSDAVSGNKQDVKDAYSSINEKYRVDKNGKKVKSDSNIKISTKGVTDKEQIKFIKTYNEQVEELKENTNLLGIAQEDLKEKTKDTISKKAQNEFDEVNKAFKKYDATTDAIDSLASEIDDDELFNLDVGGNITGMSDKGLAKLSLLQAGISTTTEKISSLTKSIADLKTKYINGTISESDYTEQLGDLQNQLSDTTNTMNSYIDSISKVMEAKKDAEIDSIKDKIDKYQELVNKRKEALKEAEKAHDYENELADSTGEIDNIQERINELTAAANSGDREALAELKDATDELAAKKKDLAETQHDHEIELTEDALDDSLDAYEDSMNTKIEQINSYYDTEEERIRQAAELTKTSYNDAWASIAEIAKENNITIADDLQSKIAQITGGIVSSDTSTSKIKTLLSNANGKGAYGSELNKYVVGLGYNQLSYANMASLAKILGISGVTAKNIDGDSKTKDKILRALKAAGFSNGGFVDASGLLSDLIKSTGEDGIALVKHGEPILTVEQGKLFSNFVRNIQPLDNLVQLNTSNLSAQTSSNPISNVTNINIAGDANELTVQQLKKYGTEITEIVSKNITKWNK